METKVKKPAAKPAVKETKKDTWEYKNRLYTLKGESTPLTFRIPSKCQWWDEENKEMRNIRYCTNQKTPFQDEQSDPAILGQIVFRDGVLSVRREDVVLQKILSIYHAGLNKYYEEEKPEEEAADQVDYINMELDAMNAARDIDIDKAEAILRVEIGSAVRNMSSKELKRDLLVMARRNPAGFLELLEDENVELRNFGIKAVEENLIGLSQDQRTFNWKSSGRKLMTIPFDENPYSALAAWFKTDEGVEVYKTITKKLK